MADVFTKKRRSEIMSNIRSKNTKMELCLFGMAKGLWKEGFRYRKHYTKIIGRPDMAFPKLKLAVFVDSEFWHGKDFRKWKKRLPSEFWKKKITSNINRDILVNKELKRKGWRVLRFWVKDIEKKPDRAILKLRKTLKNLCK